ncbi:MAG TPA: SDR family oxidoreductase [Candidatus Nanopelagicales bacterium]
MTGASRGIGRAMTRSLVGDGWQVGALARDGQRLAELAAEVGAASSALAAADSGRAADAGRAPGQVAALAADVTDPRAVADATGRLAERWGWPDLVIANAGVLAAVGPTWQVDPALWWREFEVNVRGVHATLAATLPAMVTRGSGRVVVVSSGMGGHPSPWSSAYGASKAAVTHLVGSVAEELAGTGVTVFAISPGMVRTDMTDWPDRLLVHRPELGRFPDSAYLPASAVCDLVRELATGRFDALSGRFIHAREDRAALEAEARGPRS